MARTASVALVAALLVATGAAFAYTEKLKLTPSPILGTSVTKVFSPVCECPTDVASIAFRLRGADRLSVDIVDGSGVTVRTLVRNRPALRGPVQVIWDGRDDAGEIVAEGSYLPRTRLARQRRTITLPNPIRVDLTRPVIESFRVRPRVFSPDGDGRRDSVTAFYVVSEPAQASLYVDGKRQVLKRGRREQGQIRWLGLRDGEPVAPGVYALRVGATDLAGNAARQSRAIRVVARSVALGRDRIDAIAGRRFAVLVVSDAARVRWRLARRTGSAPPGTLRLVAPTRPGRYVLVVTAPGGEARARVIVRPAPGGTP
ncbi:MAG: FlgD immunoglobulin-like domain containing protein [Gaiella sp.]